MTEIRVEFKTKAGSVIALEEIDSTIKQMLSDAMFRAFDRVICSPLDASHPCRPVAFLDDLDNGAIDSTATIVE